MSKYTIIKPDEVLDALTNGNEVLYIQPYEYVRNYTSCQKLTTARFEDILRYIKEEDENDIFIKYKEDDEEDQNNEE